MRVKRPAAYAIPSQQNSTNYHISGILIAERSKTKPTMSVDTAKALKVGPVFSTHISANEVAQARHRQTKASMKSSTPAKLTPAPKNRCARVSDKSNGLRFLCFFYKNNKSNLTAGGQQDLNRKIALESIACIHQGHEAEKQRLSESQLLDENGHYYPRGTHNILDEYDVGDYHDHSATSDPSHLPFRAPLPALLLFSSFKGDMTYFSVRFMANTVF